MAALVCRRTATARKKNDILHRDSFAIDTNFLISSKLFMLSSVRGGVDTRHQSVHLVSPPIAIRRLIWRKAFLNCVISFLTNHNLKAMVSSVKSARAIPRSLWPRR